MSKGLKTEKVADRVREHSSAADNKLIDREAEGRVRRFAGKSQEEITEQIDRLEREWDMERLLETNASILSLVGHGGLRRFAQQEMAHSAGRRDVVSRPAFGAGLVPADAGFSQIGRAHQTGDRTRKIRAQSFARRFRSASRR